MTDDGPLPFRSQANGKAIEILFGGEVWCLVPDGPHAADRATWLIHFLNGCLNFGPDGTGGDAGVH